MRSNTRCYAALFMILLICGQHGAMGAQISIANHYTKSAAHMEQHFTNFRASMFKSSCATLHKNLNTVLMKINQKLTSVCDKSGKCDYDTFSATSKLKLTWYGRRIPVIMQAAKKQMCTDLFAPSARMTAAHKLAKEDPLAKEAYDALPAAEKAQTKKLTDGIVSNFKRAIQRSSDGDNSIGAGNIELAHDRMRAAFHRLERVWDDAKPMAVLAMSKKDHGGIDPDVWESVPIDSVCPKVCQSCAKVAGPGGRAAFTCRPTAADAPAPTISGFNCSVATRLCVADRGDKLMDDMKAAVECGSKDVIATLDGQAFGDARMKTCVSSPRAEAANGTLFKQISSKSSGAPAAKDAPVKDHTDVMGIGNRLVFGLIIEVYSITAMLDLSEALQKHADAAKAPKTTNLMRNTASAGSYGVSMVETDGQPLLTPVEAVGVAIVVLILLPVVIPVIVELIIAHVVCCLFSALLRIIFENADIMGHKIYTFEQCWNTGVFGWLLSEFCVFGVAPNLVKPNGQIR